MPPASSVRNNKKPTAGKQFLMIEEQRLLK